MFVSIDGEMGGNAPVALGGFRPNRRRDVTIGPMPGLKAPRHEFCE